MKTEHVCVFQNPVLPFIIAVLPTASSYTQRVFQWKSFGRWKVFCIGILAIFLLALSEFLPQGENANTKNTVSDDSEDAYCEAMESRLAALISEVENAGRVRVLLTLESSSETVYATDVSVQSDRDDGAVSESRDSEYVLIDGTGGDAGMVLRTQTPEVQGVIVVCDGANLPEVASAITQAVSTALGVGTDRVSVLKMKPEEE